MNRQEFESDMRMLVAALIQDIGDEYRADCLDGDDDVPSMCLTIGADANGWAYQTGDNSFTGGAYSYATWAVVALYRDSVPGDIATDIARELDENDPSAYALDIPVMDVAPIFSESV